MSIESPDDHSDETPEEQSMIYRRAVESFDAGSKLDHDTMNVWNSLAYVLPSIPNSMEKAKPCLHYEEYVRKIDRNFGENGKYVGLIMQRSDREAVAAFDRLVDELNGDLERIKRENDFAALKLLVARAKELIYSRN